MARLLKHSGLLSPIFNEMAALTCSVITQADVTKVCIGAKANDCGWPLSTQSKLILLTFDMRGGAQLAGRRPSMEGLGVCRLIGAKEQGIKLILAWDGAIINDFHQYLA